MSDSKRFSEWEEVECNECSHYYDNTCDGVPIKKRKMPCNSFIAKRGVSIPNQIKHLENEIKGLKIAYTLLGFALILHLIMELL